MVSGADRYGIRSVVGSQYATGTPTTSLTMPSAVAASKAQRPPTGPTGVIPNPGQHMPADYRKPTAIPAGATRIVPTMSQAQPSSGHPSTHPGGHLPPAVNPTSNIEAHMLHLMSKHTPPHLKEFVAGPEGFRVKLETFNKLAGPESIGKFNRDVQEWRQTRQSQQPHNPATVAAGRGSSGYPDSVTSVAGAVGLVPNPQHAGRGASVMGKGLPHGIPASAGGRGAGGPAAKRQRTATSSSPTPFHNASSISSQQQSLPVGMNANMAGQAGVGVQGQVGSMFQSGAYPNMPVGPSSNPPPTSGQPPLPYGLTGPMPNQGGYPSVSQFQPSSGHAPGHAPAPGSITGSVHSSSISPAPATTTTPSKPVAKGKGKKGGGGGGAGGGGDSERTTSQLEFFRTGGDVTEMAGVNLAEEAENVMSGVDNSMVIDYGPDKDTPIVNPAVAQMKVVEAMRKQGGVRKLGENVVELISTALVDRLRTILEDMVQISRKRVETNRDESMIQITSDPRAILMQIAQRDREERTRKEEEEKAKMATEGKDGKKKELDPHTQAIRERIEKQRVEEETRIKASATNKAVLAAIGKNQQLPKFMQMLSQGGGASGPSSSSSAAAPAASDGVTPMAVEAPTASAIAKSARRVTLRDALFYLERDPLTTKSHTLYKAYLKLKAEKQIGS
eukprot:GILJ01014968.1.p1 GENE.GILJ01014968.1~~GILJ01014968.1.p1  ORF type:complete len:706 (-),score=112.04 GILJ01014968.1:109-2127(-)